MRRIPHPPRPAQRLGARTPGVRNRRAAASALASVPTEGKQSLSSNWTCLPGPVVLDVAGTVVALLRLRAFRCYYLEPEGVVGGWGTNSSSRPHRGEARRSRQRARIALSPTERCSGGSKRELVGRRFKRNASYGPRSSWLPAAKSFCPAESVIPETLNERFFFNGLLGFGSSR